MQRSSILLFASMLAAPACGGRSGGDGGIDMSDHDGGPTDAGPPDAPGPDAPTDAGGPHGDVHGFVVDHWIQSSSALRIAIDVDGDGRPDNAFAGVLQAFSMTGLDIQMSLDGAIAAGEGLELVGVQSSDPTLTNDTPVAATFQGAASHPSPDLGGTGSFTVDPIVMPTTFLAPLVAHDFTSAAPAGPAEPPFLTLRLAAFGPSPLALPIEAPEVHFVTTSTGLMSGAVYGAIAQTEVTTHLLPAIAAALDAQVTADPTSSTSMAILSIFDTGGAGGACMNPDGSHAMSGDGHVSVCELTTNGIVASVTAPDVQLHDASGAFHPTPHGTMPDAMSFGIGFTAVHATF